LTRFTSNIQKGGALIDDARRVVDVWDLQRDPVENLSRISEENLLAKPSRARADDVLLRILGPRLVDPGPEIIPALKQLLPSPRGFADAYYFEAARDDALLAAFAEGPLFDWWDEGRIRVDVESVSTWLADLTARGEAPSWSDAIRTKVARGLLAALRDFGVLAGRAHKEFTTPSLSLEGFGYAAFRLHSDGASSRALFATRVWRRWLLDPARVTELFHEAERHGILRFSSAGSAMRVDWVQPTLLEVVRAAAR
jgi:hypothetical protein